jgi:hypothetical protein
MIVRSSAINFFSKIVNSQLRQPGGSFMRVHKTLTRGKDMAQNKKTGFLLVYCKSENKLMQHLTTNAFACSKSAEV